VTPVTAVLVVVVSLALQAQADHVTVTELDLDPRRWTGAEVTVVGELVGDYSPRRRAVVWVQLNDDGYARAPLLETGERAGTNTGIGVRMPAELFDPEAWGPPGRFGMRGPIVEVTGTFHHNDPVSGETFVEAREVVLVEPARPLEEPVPTTALALGAAVLATGLALGLAAVRRRPGGVS
jgi:hypothetical protein